MAAVLEYLAAELCEIAGFHAIDWKKKRIIPRYILLAMKNDDQFDKLLPTVAVADGGFNSTVVPYLLKNRFKD